MRGFFILMICCLGLTCCFGEKRRATPLMAEHGGAIVNLTTMVAGYAQAGMPVYLRIIGVATRGRHKPGNDGRGS